MQPETPTTTPSESLSLHPIQLEFVAVRELTIRIKAPPRRSYELPEGSFGYGNFFSGFDAETRKFQVGAAVTIGDPEFSSTAIPLYLRAEIVGGFIAKDTTLTAEQVTAWAKRGAHFTLVPYLREHVTALTGRAGFTPILLPLIQIPTEKVVVSSPSEEEIAFAKARSYLQSKIPKIMDDAVLAFGFELRGKGGRLEGPDGYISPTTLRGQKLRFYVSYQDKEGAEWRIEVSIGHTDTWLPTADMYSDSGPHRFLTATSVATEDLDVLILRSKEYFDEVLQRERRNQRG